MSVVGSTPWASKLFGKSHPRPVGGRRPPTITEPLAPLASADHTTTPVRRDNAVATSAAPSRHRWAKMLLDKFGAALLILLLLPAMLVIALVVLMDGGGSVIFKQRRVGKNGRPFTMLKFRTMCTDAEARLCEVLDKAGVERGPLFKVRQDPRVTRSGAWLRRLSLDELPQLFNVLGGSMSLVGPRPQMDFEVAHYTSWQARRLLVKPGMTGLWQTSGRNDVNWEEAVALDIHYVDQWSFALDIRLLWRTIGAVCSTRGAC
jgi:lipopolysaccharide/colanic/teichoic acid biosynthesis glycosyltransferase